MVRYSEWRLGLLGKTIQYSLSPDIHNFSAQLLGRPDRYRLFDLNETELPDFLETFLSKGGRGLNVTQPYKNIIPKLIGSDLSSVNTLKRFKNKGKLYWRGYNTDEDGFDWALEQLYCQPSELKQIIIIGSGGAVDMLINWTKKLNKQTRINILRRSSRRDQELRELSHASDQINFEYLSATNLEKLLCADTAFTLLIQASSAPLYGDNLEWLLPALRGFCGFFMDLVYGKPSALFHALQQQNLKGSCDGLPMLAGQASAAQQLWWHEHIPASKILEFLMKKVCPGSV